MRKKPTLEDIHHTIEAFKTGTGIISAPCSVNVEVFDTITPIIKQAEQISQLLKEYGDYLSPETKDNINEAISALMITISKTASTPRIMVKESY